MRRRTALGGLLAAVAVAWQPNAPARYGARTLGCAAFGERVRSRIRGESGTAAVADRAGRDGLVVVRATDSSGVLAVEAWYDSLVVWRQTDAGKESPETDGFLGGRYRGVLTTTGQYQERAVPFVPDEVADVADLRSLMTEFFPPLPPIRLTVGQRWSDTTGTTIVRLADTRGPVEHYRWTTNRRRGDRVAASDGQAVTLDQLITDAGELAWSAEQGPIGWTRQVSVVARIPAREGVKRPVRTTVDQEVAVVRRFEPVFCR